ncbi:M20/M25/M40 family metallo-hydrolase [Candidatus Acetothermia bacterium]|nr:M20/M25/M40 family metallo-hydrolase [Candidatus Acetothermia bacterium]
MDKVFRYIDDHAEEFVERLRNLLHQPSVAAQSLGMEPCAQKVRAMLEGIGAKTQLLPTDGFPVVYGELSGQGAKTLSFYNHYDVQPAEPFELWQSDPWAAEIRDGKLYARGASDNKGDLTARICALEAYQKVMGALPLNLKFIIEGEEEIGSPSLGKFAEQNRKLIRADACVWEFGGKDLADRPTISLGLKGICYVELRVKSTIADAHSSIAAIVPNAAWRLTWALSTLKDKNEKVLIKGFYGKVRTPHKKEVDALRSLGFDEAGNKKKYGIKHFVKKLKGTALLRKLYYEPTCTICGISSGYSGTGPKTVLPAEAMAKIDFRLVPDQSPAETVKLLKAHLKKHGFDDLEVIPLNGEHPARTPIDEPLAQIVAKTAQQIYEKKPVVQPTSPASGPMYMLCQKFGIPAVSTGIGYAHSNGHAPNENIRVNDFIAGIKHIAMVVHEYGQRA